ncbi:MAG: hypothetical protein DMG42_06540 [Acidobacteria bacterium]|nr:MAG: hypothetical protein DMG42_06540 [Acidobacteriota bacterium]
MSYSYSGKVLAVRRVTENSGKKTPGVDREVWDTPEKEIHAVYELKHGGYHPRPLRRVYIPKSDGKTMRPLGSGEKDRSGVQAKRCRARQSTRSFRIGEMSFMPPR